MALAVLAAVLATMCVLIAAAAPASATTTSDLAMGFIKVSQGADDIQSLVLDTDTSIRAVVFNSGPDATSGPATVTFTLPADLIYQGGACDAVGNTITCQTSEAIEVNSNRSVNLTVRLSASADGVVGPINASVVGPDSDPKPSNNAGYNYVDVLTDPTHTANIQETMEFDAPIIRPGESHAVTFTVENLNPDPANPPDPALDVTIVPMLANGVQFDPDVCLPTCSLGDIAPGGVESRTFSFTVPSGEAGIGVYNVVMARTTCCENNGGSMNMPVSFGSISGTVHTVSGQPVTSGLVRVEPVNGNGTQRSASIEATGAFTLPDLGVGAYTLSAFAPTGFVTVPGEIGISLANPTVTGAVIVVPDPPPPTTGTIAGAVDPGSGVFVIQACPGTNNIANGCGGSGQRLGFVSTGAYQIPTVAPGSWTILGAYFVSGVLHGTEWVNISVVAGQTVTCNVDAVRHLVCAGFPTAPHITGTIDGANPYGVRACAGLSAPCAPSAQVIVPADPTTGAFDLALAPGAWTITGFRNPSAPTPTDSVTVQLVGGQTTTCNFVGSTVDCGGASAPVEPGGSVSTATPGGQTPADPVGTTITSPIGGVVSIEESNTPAPTGFNALGVSWVIDAPAASAAVPLKLVFDIDASLIPSGATFATIEILRDGVPIDACTTNDGTATPEPCVSNREATPGGDARITVLSAHASLWTVAIENIAPTVVIKKPTDGDTFHLGQKEKPKVTCQDEVGGSGLASCVYGPIDTTTVGTKTFTVVATDNAGNTTTVSRPYRVLYKFEGFHGGLKGPHPNVKAGKSVAAEFSLDGDQGLSVLASGSPTSRSIPCGATGVPGSEETTTGTLTYSAKGHTYSYNWATLAAWAGTCRQFIVRLADGTTQTVDVRFT